ncbi:ribosomal protein S18 acetylase RimI-like enzyme [Paraburkholderia sp. GAS82]
MEYCIATGDRNRLVDIAAQIVNNRLRPPAHNDAIPHPNEPYMTEISIRSANIDDAQKIADFHVKVWRHTYRDLAPAEAFAVLNEKFRGAKWKEKLSSNDPSHIVLIAEIDRRMVGIGAAGESSEPIFDGRGEIKFLYVDPDFKRRGIGRQLLAQLAIHLREMHYQGAALSVVKGNELAIAFYEALNGRQVAEYVDPGPIWKSQNIVFAWDDVASLIP